jgi:hypothetical protein
MKRLYVAALTAVAALMLACAAPASAFIYCVADSYTHIDGIYRVYSIVVTNQGAHTTFVGYGFCAGTGDTWVPDTWIPVSFAEMPAKAGIAATIERAVFQTFNR